MITVLYYPINNIYITKEESVEEKVFKCGQNTGNVVWAEAVKDMLHYDVMDRNCSDYAKENDVNCILPIANDISVSSSTLEIYSEQVFKESNIKVSMLGLGAQLTEELNTPKKLIAALPEQRKVALKKLSERCNLIGVRGAITAECLNELGIHNHIIIGCPSFYSHGEKFPVIKNASTEKVCFNWSGSCKDSALKKRIMEKNGISWTALIMQTMSDFPRTLTEDTKFQEHQVRRVFADEKISTEEMYQYVKKVGNIFFNTSEWKKFLQQEQFTMSVGCRFHGNMMSLLCGVPALWVTHDSRTCELTDILKLPTISLEKANKISQLDELLAYCDYGENFRQNYIKMFQAYIKCLEVNGLRKKV